MPQILDIPIATGLDENSDARLRDGLSLADDVVYKHRGGLTPRLGQEQLAPAQVVRWHSVQGNDRALVARGNQIAVVTGSVVKPLSLDVGADPIDVLGSAGIASAYVVERENLSGSCNAERSFTMAEADGFRCYAWNRGSLYVSLVDADSQAVIIPATELAPPPSTQSLPHKVVYVANTGLGAPGRFWIVWNSDSGQLIYGAQVDPVARTVNAGGIPIAGPTWLGSYGLSAIAHPAGNHFMVAYQASATTVQVDVVNGATGAVVGSATLTLPASRTVASIGLSCFVAGRLWVSIGTGGTATLQVQEFVARVDVTTPTAPTVALAPTQIWAETQTDPTAANSAYIFSTAVYDRGAGLGAWVAFSPTGRVATDSATFCRPATALYRVSDLGVADPALDAEWAFGTVLHSDIWQNAAGTAFCTVMQTYPCVQPGVGLVPPLGCMHVVAFLRGGVDSTAPLHMWPCQVHATFGVGQTPSYPTFTMGAGIQTQLRIAPSQIVVKDDGTVHTLCYALERADTSPHTYIAVLRPVKARASVQMGGRTLITGGMPSLWDGKSVVQWGFVHGPRYFGSAIANQANSIGAGTYNYAAVYEWVDANGGVVHSPVGAVLTNITFTANQKLTMYVAGAQLAHMTDAIGGMGFYTGPAFVALFRTLANSTNPYYRLTPLDVPNANWNRYGGLATLTDAYPDTGGTEGPLASHPAIYVDGGILEADPVPSCTMVTTWQARFVIAGVDDDSVWFSTENEDGEVPYFSIGLRLAPFEGGRITGLAVLDDKLVLFKGESIYTLTGQLPNKQGFGTIPSPVQVSTDAGCIDPQSVVVFPQGVMFRSARGIYLLDRSLSVSFVGEPVARSVDASAKTIAPVLVTKESHIRFDLNEEEEDAGPGNVAVFDYLRGVWTRFRYASSGDSGRAPSAQIIAADSERVYWLDGNGALWRERQNAYNDQAAASIFSFRVRSGWIKPAGVQGYFTSHRAGILGQYGIPHTLTVNVYADYDESTVVATSTWDVPANPPAGYQFVASIATGRTARMQAICIEAVVTPLTSDVGPTPPCELSSFILEWDPIDNAPQRRVSAAQKR